LHQDQIPTKSPWSITVLETILIFACVCVAHIVPFHAGPQPGGNRAIFLQNFQKHVKLLGATTGCNHFAPTTENRTKAAIIFTPYKNIIWLQPWITTKHDLRVPRYRPLAVPY